MTDVVLCLSYEDCASAADRFVRAVGFDEVERRGEGRDPARVELPDLAAQP
jgi:hypothetical protein